MKIIGKITTWGVVLSTIFLGGCPVAPGEDTVLPPTADYTRQVTMTIPTSNPVILAVPSSCNYTAQVTCVADPTGGFADVEVIATETGVCTFTLSNFLTYSFFLKQEGRYCAEVRKAGAERLILTAGTSDEQLGTLSVSGGNLESLATSDRILATLPVSAADCNSDGIPDQYDAHSCGQACNTAGEGGLCEDGFSCNIPGDCISKICTSNLCVVPTCADGVINQGETDAIDGSNECGGPNCDPCPDAGDVCKVGADCASEVCQEGTCRIATCGNEGEAADGNETDIDCGGADCGKCGDGLACGVDGDCGSGKCGKACELDTTKGCNIDDDCGLDGPCLTGPYCVAAQCDDGLKNGNETDVDCGGSCDPCADTGSAGNACKVGSDCVSGVCQAGKCRIGTCGNTVQDGNETDVNCGGTGDNGCGPCVFQDSCAVGGDCVGGTCGMACSNGTACTVDANCTGIGDGLCSAADVCVATCSDGIKNQNEAGIDCGGACPACT